MAYVIVKSTLIDMAEGEHRIFDRAKIALLKRGPDSFLVRQMRAGGDPVEHEFTLDQCTAWLAKRLEFMRPFNSFIPGGGSRQ